MQQKNYSVLEGYVTRWNSSFAKKPGELWKMKHLLWWTFSLFKMPDLYFLFFSSWYSVGILWVSQEKLNFLPDDSHWVNTLRVRHSQNKCPSTLPQRILILGTLHSLRVTQHENGWNSGKHNMPKPLKDLNFRWWITPIAQQN